MCFIAYMHKSNVRANALLDLETVDDRRERAGRVEPVNKGNWALSENVKFLFIKGWSRYVHQAK